MTTADTSRYPWDLADLHIDGSPVASHPWHRPPRAWIDGDRLYWQYTLLQGDEDVEEEFPVGFGPIVLTDTPKPTRVERGALLEFVNLPKRPRRAIASFASRWGVLHLCGHGLPRTHPQWTPPLDGDEQRQGSYCETVFGVDMQGSELINFYLAWALRARAVLNIASTFDGRKRDVDLVVEWSVLIGEDQAKQVAIDSDASKRRLASELAVWLRIGAVQPRINLVEPPWITVGGPELFGMLAVQLATAVKSGAPTICSSCSTGYVAKKQPSAGRRNYCRRCRTKGVPQRDASRAYRQRTATHGHGVARR